MSCELIQVDFKKGVIKQRQMLDGVKRAYNPYKDEGFKGLTSGIAELAVYAHENGAAYPSKMIVISTDEEVELDLVMFDERLISTEETICAMKRCIEKLENSLKDPTGAA